MRLTVSLLLLALAASPTASLAQSELDTAKIEQVIGVKGATIPAEHVFKVTKARNDVKVQVDGWSMPPFMGLGSWAAFTPSAHGAMVMGDTVLFEDEVNPAMSAALDSGLEVTALHNHFFFDQPRVYFMHIAGMGDEAQARRGREERSGTRSPKSAPPTPPLQKPLAGRTSPPKTPSRPRRSKPSSV